VFSTASAAPSRVCRKASGWLLRKIANIRLVQSRKRGAISSKNTSGARRRAAAVPPVGGLFGRLQRTSRPTPRSRPFQHLQDGYIQKVDQRKTAHAAPKIARDVVGNDLADPLADAVPVPRHFAGQGERGPIRNAGTTHVTGMPAENPDHTAEWLIPKRGRDPAIGWCWPERPATGR